MQGLARTIIPAGDSIEGEYLETGRGMAVLVAAGHRGKAMDTPLTVGDGGVFEIASGGHTGSVEGNHYIPAVEGTPRNSRLTVTTPAIPAVPGTPEVLAVEGTPAIPADPVLAYAKETYTCRANTPELVWVRGA